MRATRDQAGSAAVELAILAPVLVIVLLFTVAVGRLVLARQEVDNAAADAVRAASVAGTPEGALSEAQSVAAADLSADHITCAPIATVTDTSSFFPGGVVKVSVSCATTLSDLSLLALPGHTTLVASAAEVIDRYRSLPTLGGGG